MCEANQQIPSLERLSDEMLDFYYRNVMAHLERKAEAIAASGKGG